MACAVTARVLDWADAGLVVDALRAGALVVLPTDTLPGFSCRADAAPAMTRLRALKGAAFDRGFVVLAAAPAVIEPWLAPVQDARAWRFACAVWPGPLSAVVAVRAGTPGALATGALHTLAVRVPNSAPLRVVLAQLGSPVVSTSVNRHGEPPCVDTAAIVAQFGDRVDCVVREPAAAVARASTLADCTRWPPRLLRGGDCDLDAALSEFAARPDGGEA